MLQSFRNAPASRQLMIVGGLGLFLCAVLVAVYFLFLRTSYAVLYRDLREADAATITAELERSHVDYRLADGGQTILVPEGAVDATRLHVASRDLPLQGTVGFELFNNSSIGLSEFAQRINLQRALQGELQRTIMSIDGVEAARVHLALGEQTPFRGDRRPPRASVTIRTVPGRALAPTTVRGIQRLVAGSVPEMDVANVAVINERGALVSVEAPAEPAASSVDAERQRVESFFEARVRRAVEQRFPADAIEVSVWAGLHEQGPPAANAGPVDPTAEGRGYRLRVTVAIAQGLSNQARAQLTSAVEQAIGFDAAVGDSVAVTASAPLPGTGDPLAGNAMVDAPVIATPREPAGAANGGMLQSIWTPLLVLTLIGVIVLLLRRRAVSDGRMSEQDRLAYVANLRTLLAERSADAAPPA
jgi:flagellar M-ring protein FliF